MNCVRWLGCFITNLSSLSLTSARRPSVSTSRVQCINTVVKWASRYLQSRTDGRYGNITRYTRLARLCHSIFDRIHFLFLFPYSFTCTWTAGVVTNSNRLIWTRLNSVRSLVSRRRFIRYIANNKWIQLSQSILYTGWYLTYYLNLYIYKHTDTYKTNEKCSFASMNFIIPPEKKMKK